MGKRPAFDIVGERFVDDYYGTVRGLVREEVTRNNLFPFLPTPPALVADIGGGDGRDSAWLADQGYEVTLVDQSTFMLDRSQRWGAVLDRINGDQTTLIKDGKAGAYDLVLSHCVLMYDLEDPLGHMQALADHLKKGGILSFLTKGYGGLAVRYNERGEIDRLQKLEATHQFQQSQDGLGQHAWAFDQSEIEAMLERTGFTVLDWAGVRIVSDDDRRQWRSIPGSELHAILREEKQLAHDPVKKQHAQMIHFIAKKD